MYSGTIPRNNTQRRVAFRYSAAPLPLVIRNIQFAPSSYGMLKVARNPDTIKKDNIRGASISPVRETERTKYVSRLNTNSDEIVKAKPIPLYIAINRRCFGLRPNTFPMK